MKANISISSVQGTSTDGQPIIATRSYGGDFTVMNGEYIVIGGLGQSSFTSTASAVPYLGSMPVLGRFFKSSSDEKNTKSLLIFLRPVVKNSFYKGVKPVYVDKTAAFVNFEEGKLNHNTTQITRYAKDAKDPFAKSQVMAAMREVDARIESLTATKEVIEKEKQEAVAPIIQKEEALKLEVETLKNEIKSSWNDPVKLEEVATKKVEADVKLNDVVAEKVKVETTFDEAIKPLEVKIENAKKEREVSAQELKRLEELDKLYVPQFKEDGQLRITNQPKVDVKVGTQTTDAIVNPNVVVEDITKRETTEGVTSKVKGEAAVKPVPVTKTETPAVKVEVKVETPVTKPVEVIAPVVIEPSVVVPEVKAPEVKVVPTVVKPVVPVLKPSIDVGDLEPATVVPTKPTPPVTPKPVTVPKPEVKVTVPAIVTPPVTNPITTKPEVKATAPVPATKPAAPATNGSNPLDLDSLFEELEAK